MYGSRHYIGESVNLGKNRTVPENERTVIPKKKQRGMGKGKRRRAKRLAAIRRFQERSGQIVKEPSASTRKSSFADDRQDVEKARIAKLVQGRRDAGLRQSVKHMGLTEYLSDRLLSLELHTAEEVYLEGKDRLRRKGFRERSIQTIDEKLKMLHVTDWK